MPAVLLHGFRGHANAPLLAQLVLIVGAVRDNVGQGAISDLFEKKQNIQTNIKQNIQQNIQQNTKTKKTTK